MNISEMITPPKTIAVVGLSDKRERQSYQVAEYLLSEGYTILPINPMIESVFGLKAYDSIADVPDDITIDIVDIFRRSEEVPGIVEQVIQTGRKPLIWMQEGVLSLEAEKIARDAGLEVVMNACLMKQQQGR